MVLDAYMQSHQHNFEKTIHVYSDDNIEEKMLESFDGAFGIAQDACRAITRVREGMHLLDERYISCIGIRIWFHQSWYIIHVWKSKKSSR